MKRFIICLSVFLLLMGLRLSDNSVLACGFKGEYSVWEKGGAVTTYSGQNTPFIASQKCYATRLDFYGLSSDAFEAIKNLGGRIKWSEVLNDDLRVIYAYSPQILRYKVINNIKINIMVAISNNKICIGSPLLVGSY